MIQLLRTADLVVGRGNRYVTVIANKGALDSKSIKVLTALVDRLSMSIGSENGPELVSLTLNFL